MKDFYSLSQREILALAISLEEEDERVYADFAEGLEAVRKQASAIEVETRRFYERAAARAEDAGGTNNCSTTWLKQSERTKTGPRN